MSEPYLRQLSPNDGLDIYEMLQEIPKDDNGFGNDFNGLDYETEFKHMLIVRDKESRGEDLQEDRVPQTWYWMYDGDRPVGLIKIRHYLNDYLKEHGGHIGYAIRPSERSKGYGTKMLNLALEKAKEMGIEDIMFTCNPDNIASRKVIEKNGGELAKVTDDYAFYWIKQ